MLTGIFNRVGLWTKIRKTVGMVCQPYQAAGVWEDKAYTRQMTREGRIFEGRQQDWVLFPECGKDLVKG